MTDLATRVLATLQKRRDVTAAPAARRYLCELLKCKDRPLRKAIEDLRAEGYPIIAHPKGGYYYSARPEDIRLLYDQCRMRLVAHARTMKAFRGRVPLLPDEGQEVLDLLGETETDEGGET